MRWLLAFISVSMSYCLWVHALDTIGSIDATVTPSIVTTRHFLQDGDYARGMIHFTKGLAVDPNATVTIGITNPVQGDVTIWPGAHIYLEKPLTLAGSKFITLGGADNPTSYTSTSTLEAATITFSPADPDDYLSMNFLNDVYVWSPIKFTARFNYLNFLGNSLVFDQADLVSRRGIFMVDNPITSFLFISNAIVKNLCDMSDIGVSDVVGPRLRGNFDAQLPDDPYGSGPFFADIYTRIPPLYSSASVTDGISVPVSASHFFYFDNSTLYLNDSTTLEQETTMTCTGVQIVVAGVSNLVGFVKRTTQVDFYDSLIVPKTSTLTVGPNLTLNFTTTGFRLFTPNDIDLTPFLVHPEAFVTLKDSRILFNQPFYMEGTSFAIDGDVLFKGTAADQDLRVVSLNFETSGEVSYDGRFDILPSSKIIFDNTTLRNYNYTRQR